MGEIWAACVSTVSTLEDLDQQMSEGRTDERAVDGHLGDSGCEVVSVLATILSNPGGEDFL